MPRKTEKHALRCNLISLFLVKHCDESNSETKIGLVELFSRFEQMSEYKGYGYMWLDEFARYLKMAGVKIESEPTGRGKEMKRWVHGVVPKEYHPSTTPLKQITLAQANQINRQHPPLSSKTFESDNLVMLQGHTWYSKDLIATFRKIAPFKKFNSTDYAEFIVTFKNPELGHKFLTAEEAQELSSALNLPVPMKGK